MSQPFINRTSDRASFRKCRRRWVLSSHHYKNRGPVESVLPLWTGTGFHYALEDFYGYQIFKSASEAFLAFADAWKRTPKLQMPDGWEEDTQMATACLDYYQHVWLENRYDYPTLIVDGLPQVEQTWQIPLGTHSGREVIYQGTFDRVSVDDDGLLWVVEYKSAIRVEYKHYNTDQQTTAYIWAAQKIYDRECAGVVYQQHKKHIPEGPKILATGRISLNKQQITSRTLYKGELLKLYSTPEKFPSEYVDYLDYLASVETEHRDAYIERELVRRNPAQLLAEEEKISLELIDMLNPNLPIYPNPSRDCGYCPFESICVSIDDGSDWESELDLTTQERVEELDFSWRLHLNQLSQTPNDQLQRQQQPLVNQ